MIESPKSSEPSSDRRDSFDDQEIFSFVNSTARIAVYDNLRSAPRMIEVPPAPTGEYIMSIASKTYMAARDMGGKLPFTVIQEVSENFIHARFSEVVVSVLDGGNTIRFADQGPGIPDIEKAQLPGFTSASKQMKEYIRGVGSGLPIVREYLENEQGTVLIEDNINSGAVVTISLKEPRNQEESRLRGALASSSDLSREEGDPAVKESAQQGGVGDQLHPSVSNSIPEASRQRSLNIPALESRDEQILLLLMENGPMRLIDISREMQIAGSTVHKALEKLTALDLVEQPPKTKKRTLTEYGELVAESL